MQYTGEELYTVHQRTNVKQGFALKAWHYLSEKEKEQWDNTAAALNKAIGPTTQDQHTTATVVRKEATVVTVAQSVPVPVHVPPKLDDVVRCTGHVYTKSGMCCYCDAPRPVRAGRFGGGRYGDDTKVG